MPFLRETDPPFVYERETVSELNIPDAWHWAHPRGPPATLHESGYKGFNDWGYVFWDLERLHRSGILLQDRNAVRRISFWEHEENHQPSVQTRLREKHGLPDFVRYNDLRANEDLREVDEEADGEEEWKLSKMRAWRKWMRKQMKKKKSGMKKSQRTRTSVSKRIQTSRWRRAASAVEDEDLEEIDEEAEEEEWSEQEESEDKDEWYDVESEEEEVWFDCLNNLLQVSNLRMY